MKQEKEELEKKINLEKSELDKKQRMERHELKMRHENLRTELAKKHSQDKEKRVMAKSMEEKQTAKRKKSSQDSEIEDLTDDGTNAQKKRRNSKKKSTASTSDYFDCSSQLNNFQSPNVNVILITGTNNQKQSQNNCDLTEGLVNYKCESMRTPNDLQQYLIESETTNQTNEFTNQEYELLMQPLTDDLFKQLTSTPDSSYIIKNNNQDDSDDSLIL